MESYRTKIGIFGLIVMILIGIIFHWYTDFSTLIVESNSDTIYLTHEQKVDHFRESNVDSYDAFYEQVSVVEKQKTVFPFIYDKKVKSVVDTKIKTRK